MLRLHTLQLSGAAAAAVAILVALLLGYASSGRAVNPVLLSVFVLALGGSAAAIAYYYLYHVGKLRKDGLDSGAANAKADSIRLGPPSSYGLKVCSQCAVEMEKMDSCSRCKALFFCSRECQKKAWKWHKNDCQETAPTIVQQEAPAAALVSGKKKGSAKDVARQAEVASSLQDAKEAMSNGHPKLARRHAELCARVAKKVNSHKTHGEALQILGQACLQLDDKAAAEQAYTQLVELGQDLRDASLEGQGLIGRGAVACRRDGEAAAITFHEQAIKLVRHSQDKLSEEIVSMEASARASRGRCLIEIGRAPEAVQELRQVVSLRRLSVAASSDAEMKKKLANALISLAAALRGVDDAGNQDEVRQLLNEAHSEATAAGDTKTQLAAQTSLNSLPNLTLPLI